MGLYLGIALGALTVLWVGWNLTLDALWQPTDKVTVRRILFLAGVKEGEHVLDLGCGDGRFVVTAAREFKARATGVEIDPLRVLWARAWVALAGLSRRARIIWGNMYTADLSDADVVILFLSATANFKLQGRLRRGLKPGARIVSYYHPIWGWMRSGRRRGATRSISIGSGGRMRRDLASLLEAIGFSSRPEWEGVEITGITEDSRRVQAGSLFVAIRGFVDDGHRYIDEAVVRGASAVIVEQETLASLSCAVPCIRVTDARVALAQLSAAFFSNPTRKLFTIGITGTNGKTTVCHLIAHLLGEQETTLISTVANEYRGLRAVTTPSSPILQEIAHEAVSAGRKNLVIEVSSAALPLHRVETVDFDAAVFTNLTHDHLDFHEDKESYLSAKLLLFRDLKPEAWAIVNADDPACDKVLAATRANPLTYGIHRDADLRATDVHCELKEVTFTLQSRDKNLPVQLHLSGEHNVSNALAAAAVATLKGMSLEAIAGALASARSVEGRYQFFWAKSGASVIVDFAHSPDSLEQMLHSLCPFYKRVICVFGCGGESDRKKRPLMGEVSGRLAEITILTSDNPKTEDPEAIIDEIEVGIIPTGGVYERIVDRREAIRRAVSLARPEDVILLAGKGHEPYQIVGHEFVPYSDAGFLRDAGLVE